MAIPLLTLPLACQVCYDQAMGAQPTTQPPARGRGQPSKLTPDVQARIVAAVRAGNFLDVAARYAGVTYRTFRNWMVRGEQEEQRLTDPHARPRESEALYLHFFQEISQAEAEAEMAAVAYWQTAIPNNWQAAAAFVQARWRRRWAQQQGLLNLQLNLSSDELARLADEELAELSEGRIPPGLLERLGRRPA